MENNITVIFKDENDNTEKERIEEFTNVASLKNISVKVEKCKALMSLQDFDFPVIKVKGRLYSYNDGYKLLVSMDD